MSIVWCIELEYFQSICFPLKHFVELFFVCVSTGPVSSIPNKALNIQWTSSASEWKPFHEVANVTIHFPGIFTFQSFISLSFSYSAPPNNIYVTVFPLRGRFLYFIARIRIFFCISVLAFFVIRLTSNKLPPSEAEVEHWKYFYLLPFVWTNYNLLFNSSISLFTPELNCSESDHWGTFDFKQSYAMLLADRDNGHL